MMMRILNIFLLYIGALTNGIINMVIEFLRKIKLIAS